MKFWYAPYEADLTIGTQDQVLLFNKSQGFKLFCPCLLSPWEQNLLWSSPNPGRYRTQLTDAPNTLSLDRRTNASRLFFTMTRVSFYYIPSHLFWNNLSSVEELIIDFFLGLSFLCSSQAHPFLWSGAGFRQDPSSEHFEQWRNKSHVESLQHSEGYFRGRKTRKSIMTPWPSKWARSRHEPCSRHLPRHRVLSASTPRKTLFNMLFEEVQETGLSGELPTTLVP